MKRASVTVTWDEKEERWAVKLRGFSSVSAKRKADAVVIAVEAAKEHQPSRLLIYRKKGSGLQSRRNYPR